MASISKFRTAGPAGEGKAVEGLLADSDGLIDAPPLAPHGRTILTDLDLRIDRDGHWSYHGSPIERKELVCLFAQALVRDRAGAYWLVTPTEIGAVVVEDAPFLGVELFAAGAGCTRAISVRTNVDQIVTIDAAHPLTVVTDPATGEPRPYVGLDHGLTARLTRAAYYELVALGGFETVDGVRRYGVWSGGRFFVLGDLECPP
jgi:hypothetical protein